MQKKIDEYFEWCKGYPLTGADGTPLLNKYGEPVMMEVHPPTITGLALAIGFNNRISLLEYAEKDEFANTITRAKARVERYAEERLYDRDGARGAEFSLRNNFRKWNGEQKEQVNVADLLKNIQTMADLINAPKENRNIDDFE